MRYHFTKLLRHIIMIITRVLNFYYIFYLIPIKLDDRTCIHCIYILFSCVDVTGVISNMFLRAHAWPFQFDLQRF